jgi:hypothetical protein
LRASRPGLFFRTASRDAMNGSAFRADGAQFKGERALNLGSALTHLRTPWLDIVMVHFKAGDGISNGSIGSVSSTSSDIYAFGTDDDKLQIRRSLCGASAGSCAQSDTSVGGQLNQARLGSSSTSLASRAPDPEDVPRSEKVSPHYRPPTSSPISGMHTNRDLTRLLISAQADFTC